MCLSKAIRIRKIQNQFKDFFTLANTTLQISSKYLDKIENQFSNNIPVGAKRVCVTLFIQANRLLTSTIILCKRGLDEEASILARSHLENASYLMYISEKNHEERTELYMHSRALSEAKAVRQLNSYTPEGEEKIDETFFLENERKAFDYLRKKYGKGKTDQEIKRCALRADIAANRLQGDIKKFFLSTYRIFYPQISSVAHAEAPLNFIYHENDKLHFKRWSRGKTTKLCLQAVTILTLLNIENLSKLLQIDIGEDIQPIITRLFSLLESK
ncbi:MAG: hypothetical protein KAT05_12200 [Spirochaetes bacterium]|nr:hypothetical protein [Spirochaetota bacterium]